MRESAPSTTPPGKLAAMIVVCKVKRRAGWVTPHSTAMKCEVSSASLALNLINEWLCLLCWTTHRKVQVNGWRTRQDPDAPAKTCAVVIGLWVHSPIASLNMAHRRGSCRGKHARGRCNSRLADSCSPRTVVSSFSAQGAMQPRALTKSEQMLGLEPLLRSPRDGSSRYRVPRS